MKYRSVLKVGKVLGACLAFVVLAGLFLQQCQQEAVIQGLSHKIIRFHVIADSDSPQDQKLKLLVRDAVGVYMQKELAEVKDIGESRKIIEADLKNIEQQAQETLRAYGCQDAVSAVLTTVEFPEKTYGPYTFPAGEYQAVQLVLGSGQGQNWWCVMYPNLCFFDNTYQVVEEEADSSLREILTTQEYKTIMENGQYQIRFKWLSFLN